MRTCCISLLGHNVGINHINPIITEVLQLAGKRPSRMPSLTLLRQMVFEGLAAALSQLSEVASKNTTLHYDGTTKFGKKFGGFQLTTSEGQYTISVNDLVSGSTEHTLDLSKVFVQEITIAGEKSSG